MPENKCTHDCQSCMRECLSKLNNTDVVTHSALGAQEPKKPEITEACVLAIDLGTTTIAMQLIGRDSGTVYDTYTSLNLQIRYGKDVISRIQAAKEHAEEMRDLVLKVLRLGAMQLLENVTGPVTACLAGNTVMTHILLGMDVSGLGEAPFQPMSLAENAFALSYIGQDRKQHNLPVRTVPMLSAFVGGDLTAGILATDLKAGELLVDLGTNGEIILGTEDAEGKTCYLATSTAAGGAFQRPGDAVQGSDRIGMLADMFAAGIVDETGYMGEKNAVSEEKPGDTAGGLTQEDVRDLQLAKAAIHAGVLVLLKKAGMKAEDVTKVHLAGGFGYHLDTDAAITVGMLPKEMKGRIEAVGNTSLYGAYLYAKLAEELMAVDITQRVASVNLAEEPDFYELYIGNMNLPID